MFTVRSGRGQVGSRERPRETYDIDELTQFEFDADAQHVGGVDDRPHQLVVVGEEVVVEALGVGVAGGGGAEQAAGRQPPHERAHQLATGHIVT